MIRLALVLSLAPAAALVSLPREAPLPAAPTPEQAGFFSVGRDRWAQEIFFAVLEGLYTDGVRNETVDRILAVDPVTGYPENFVWTCPICMPALDALRLYRARPPFQGIKPGDLDTFGRGLGEDVRSELESPALLVRQGAIRELVERWVDRRVTSLRLDERERAQWDHAMEDMRKQGMARLAEYRRQGLGGSYAEMTDCAFCDGANDPFENR